MSQGQTASYIYSHAPTTTAEFRAPLYDDNARANRNDRAQRTATGPIDEDAISAITERARTSRIASIPPNLHGSSHSGSGSHSSRALTLVRRSSNSTSAPSLSFYTPPESVSDRRDSGSATQTSESLAKYKKKNKFTSFFSLKEPSTCAFAEMQAMMEEEKKKKGHIAVPTRKMPEGVPAVNSRWDGLPEHARREIKMNKRKAKEKEKFRSNTKYSMAFEPVGLISYDTLDPKAHGEMPMSPSWVAEEPSSPDESLPRTPTTPRSPPLPALPEPRKWAQRQAVEPAPVSREDAAPWEFMEGPPEPSDYMSTRPSTVVSDRPTTEKGKKFGFFGKK